MRVPIREQLAIFGLLISLLALAVISIATWITNHNLVVHVGLQSLSLTASLKAAQLATSLMLVQTSVQATSTRVLLQNALSRYNHGNNTYQNWYNAGIDLQSSLTSGSAAAVLLQARVVSKNGTGSGGPYGLVNVTGNLSGPLQLPYENPDGSPVYLGDNDTAGYPPSLYPNLTYASVIINDTFNESRAFFNGNELSETSRLFLGPLQINATFALFSLTVPVVNNTSVSDILGWITVVMDGDLIYSIVTSREGLGNTGVCLIVGPVTQNNTFPPGILYNSESRIQKPADEATLVQFILPPSVNASRSSRHSKRQYGQANSPFTMGDYPAVLNAFTSNHSSIDNAGSLLSTTDEDGDSVAVGYALPANPLANWVLLVEQAHSEVIQPINHLRNVLLACVFGTIGAICLLLYPIAHFSVLPIRRLRHATGRTVDPLGFNSDDSSEASSKSDNEDGSPTGIDETSAQEAKKEGYFGRMSGWRRNRRKARAERPDVSRRTSFRIPGKVPDRKHVIEDELTDLTATYNEMTEELMKQYERLEERVKERTQELEMSKKAAEAANESKTLFIANISHELKTPLNGILGMCAVCMQEEDQTKIQRSLGIIYKSGDLLLHLLNDLLTFSKNQIGHQLSLDEREFRLADISSQILSVFDKQAKEGLITLRLNYEGPTEISSLDPNAQIQSAHGPPGTGRVKDMCLWGDQHRILQVVINLVSNSLKFTPPGGSVSVRLKCLFETEERASRRDSTPSKHSKHSKQSKQSRQSKGSRKKIRGRVTSGSAASSVSPNRNSSDEIKGMHTALEINKREPKQPSIITRERSVSPPRNARVLMFEFEVQDTGPGIPESQQRLIFEPFVQGDLGLSKKYGGTGLGLSICSQLAGLMRGSMSLSSTPGQGSTFSLRIPLKFINAKVDSTASSFINPNSQRNSLDIDAVNGELQPLQRKGSSSGSSTKSDSAVMPVQLPEPSAKDTLPASKPRLVGLSQPFFAATSPLESAPTSQQVAAIERVAAVASSGGTMVRVLVAEDNKVNQEVVLRMLKLEDVYDVTVARDGQEAFELVKASMDQQKPFDLIFMDIQMPELDGLQSTRLIRQVGFSAPIVALTAFAEESNVKECMDSGMDYFLPKPIRRPALKQVLKRYCATILEAAEEGDSPQSAKQKTDSLLAKKEGLSPDP